MNLRIFITAVAVVLAGFLCSPKAVGQQPQAPIVRVIDVQYAGASSIAKAKILANMQTRVGRAYDEKTVEDDIRNLYATGNITNVRIFGEPLRDGVKVIVVVQAKEQVTAVTISGVRVMKESRVRKQITTKVGDTLSESNLEVDRQKIIDYYSGKGYTEVKVKAVIDRNEKLATARVGFEIVEGEKVEVDSVKFEGNVAVKTKDLKKVVKTKSHNVLSFLFKTGRLNSELMEADIAAIRELYESRGYVDVEVAAPKVERRGADASVVFVIREGIQYHVNKVSIAGAQVFSADELSEKMKLKAGEVYSPQGVRKDIKTMQDLYGARGYIDFQGGVDTTPAGKGLVNVAIRIDEGTQSYLEHINISGNTRTKDKVIRREVAVEPGDVFNTVRVDASKQRLTNLNYFSKVEAYPSDTLIPGRKDLNISVEEKRTGSLNFGAGFSSIDSILGFAEVTQGNFDITNWPRLTGGGQKFRMRVQYGAQRKDFIIALTEPYFLDYKFSLGGEIFYRDAAYVSSVYQERRYGFDLTARKSINQFTYTRFGYRLENVDIYDVDNDASQAIKNEQGEKLKSQISAGITYDTRDSLMLTRKGHKVDLQTYLAGGFLGGDVQIYGFSLEGSKYFLLPGDTILSFYGEIANVSTWGGGDEVPIFDRLYLGGANNLRGFDYREVGPKDRDGEPIGGRSLIRGTVEYTFPVVDKVRGAVFYDAGSVARDAYDLGKFNSDVGVGVRLDLPIGPVRIDYGIPVTSDRYNDSSGKFNFNIGYQF